jgi:hypothetical protein
VGRRCPSRPTTHSFQAPDFYRRFGFEAAGEIPEHPAGHSLVLMRLALR